MLMLCCGILLLLIHLSPHLKSTVAANFDFETTGSKKLSIEQQGVDFQLQELCIHIRAFMHTSTTLCAFRQHHLD